MPRCRRSCFTLDNANPMVALNSAMMTDGVVIEIANGVVLTQPLHIIHVASGSAPAAMFTRSLLRLGKDAGATLVESYIAADGAKAYQAHDSLIVAIGDNSRLDHVRLIEDGREAFNISSAVFTLGAHAHFNTFGMTSGAAVSRYQATIAFAGEHSRSRPTASICSTAASTPTPRCSWTMRCRIAPAARFSALSPTTAPIRCSRAASSCAPKRRRPTPR